MPSQAAKEPRKLKKVQANHEQGPTASGREPVHCQLVSPCEDPQVRIANRAYELHAERGYRQGHALDDWLEAEQDVLGLKHSS